MAYNTWKGDAAVGDVVNQDDIDTLIDWDENTITLKTNNAARLVVDNSSVSGSGDLEFAGNTFLGGTLNVTGNITTVGDLILDDGGSLKEAGGTAAFTYDGSGHVTKIGQDTPSNGQVLTWDTGGTPDRAVWSAAAGAAAGSDTQVQFNDGGSNLGGDGGLTYNKTTDVLSFVNASGSGILQTVGATILGSTLNVSGAVTLAANTSATNITATSLSASANLQSAGPTTLGSTLNVSGAVTMAGNLVGTAISGSGTLQMVGGATIGQSLHVSGALGNIASIGLGTTAVHATAVRQLSIADGTQPQFATANQISIGSKQSTGLTSDGSTLTLQTECLAQNTALDAVGTLSHRITIWLNGIEYYLYLDPV